MFQKFLFTFLLVLFGIRAVAQSDSTTHKPGLRISLLSCGTGPEIWATFGHNGLRITDSSAGTDLVYNYGTFNGFEDNFEIKFMRGQLMYYLSVGRMDDFMEEYKYYGRSVDEQVLDITQEQAQKVQNFLYENLKEDNKYYKYDFLFDNCATRIRDIFPYGLGPGFEFGKVLPDGSKLTFRQIINQYLYREHLQRLGINILFGKSVDKVMNDQDIMFLPDYLKESISNATLEGKPIAGPPQRLLESASKAPTGLNTALILTLAIALLTTFAVLTKQKTMISIMQFTVLFVTGVLGIIMLLMWFGTDHLCCKNNFNILWALPSNFIVAFAPKRSLRAYSILALLALAAVFILHISGVQEYVLTELAPLFWSLILIYARLYKNSTPIKRTQ